MKAELLVATLQEILEAFEAADVLLLDNSYDELIQMYGRELSMMFGYAKHATKPSIFLGLPSFSERQCTIHFSVSDLAIPKENKFNWHLQNTSQWLYAGAIVYDKTDGSLSSHY